MLRKISQDEISEFYKEMYLPYIEELKSFGGGDGMSESVLRYHLCNCPMSAYAITCDGEDAGFLITEEVSPPSIYTPMLFLVEFYVRKECRRKGIGQKAAEELIEGLDIPIFFTVLPKNEGAGAFWRRVIALNGLVPARPDAGQLRFAEGVDLYCYRRR